MFTGLSRIRGGFTFVDGAAVSPTAFSSSTPVGKSVAVRFICPAIDPTTTLTTNCRVALMFAAVSFGVCGARSPTPSTTTGGSDPMQLKKLKGAAFTTPSTSIVVTNAIGRGTMTAVNSA
jgi:hypothetical protein